MTHHHADHVGGVADLRPRLQGPVYGPRRERIPEPFVALDDGDAVEVLGLHFTVIDVPGHTAGHIAYFHRTSGGAAPDPVLRRHALLRRLRPAVRRHARADAPFAVARWPALPGATRVCCAHEYTLSNLKFARAVEPVNAALADYTAWCEAQRATGQPTLPSSIATERLVNPFLRCAEPGVALTAQTRGAPSTDPVAVLAALRQWKNEFR